MFLPDPIHLPLWQLVTRLGEAEILLPAALVAALTLVWRAHARPLVLWWMALLGSAALLTTLSKLAFMGWGLGWAEINFTGISGHAMFAAAIYPLLLGTLAAHAPRRVRQLAIGAGFALAAVVAYSRVVVGAHSYSEALAGALLGAGVSAVVLSVANLPRTLIGPLLPLAMGLWLSLMPVHASASYTHSAVTRLALALSGRDAPYTRADLLRARRLHAGGDKVSSI